MRQSVFGMAYFATLCKYFMPLLTVCLLITKPLCGDYKSTTVLIDTL